MDRCTILVMLNTRCLASTPWAPPQCLSIAFQVLAGKYIVLLVPVAYAQLKPGALALSSGILSPERHDLGHG